MTTWLLFAGVARSNNKVHFLPFRIFKSTPSPYRKVFSLRNLLTYCEATKQNLWNQLLSHLFEFIFHRSLTSQAFPISQKKKKKFIAEFSLRQYNVNEHLFVWWHKHIYLWLLWKNWDQGVSQRSSILTLYMHRSLIRLQGKLRI